MPLNHTPVIASRTSLPAVPSDLEALKAEESRLQSLLTEVRTQKLKNLQSKPLRIAVVGFGRFGQFISKTFCKTADVVAVSRSDYSAIAKDMGVEYVPLTDFSSLFGDDKPAIDVVVLSTSILSFERMISQISSAVGDAAGPLVVDVLSVKEHPRRVMLTELPPQCDILCTHPMFGPDSAKNGWGGLNFVYEKTRINGVVDYVSNEDTSPPSNMEYGIDRVERFLSIFEEEGCKMVSRSKRATAAPNALRAGQNPLPRLRTCCEPAKTRYSGSNALPRLKTRRDPLKMHCEPVKTRYSLAKRTNLVWPSLPLPPLVHTCVWR